MKYKNLIIVYFLITIWSLFFAIYKYFIWWIFKNDIITLQFISWYLSIWTIFSFIIWGLFYEIFKERLYHFSIILFTILTIFSIFLLNNVNIEKHILVWAITIFIWFFYWLWWVLRNILISDEIQETNIKETKINWLANIFFISSIIVWSILWWIIEEKFNINWLFLILWMLFVWLLAWIWLKFKKIDKSLNLKIKALEYKKNYINDFKFIIKKYFIVMFFSALLITSWTILSQKAVEYYVEIWWKTASSSALILLFTAIWSIIWNIISMKIWENRWKIFLIFSILFSISCLLFPTLISNFKNTSILATITWIFFWITYNIIESYFFKKIALDNKKSYGSVSLWIITSITIAFLMFFIDIIDKNFWFAWVYYFIWLIIFLIWIKTFNIRKKLS